MDNFKEQEQLGKRTQNAKAVLVTFPIKSNYQIFNIVDEHGSLKYDGFVQGHQPHKDDYCSCPSFTHNNHSKEQGSYIDTHGYAFQCKHIIAARDDAKTTLSQIENLQSFPLEAKPRDTTFDESKLIQRDLLL